MAYGLTPVRHMTGGVIRVNNFQDYRIDDGYTTSLYMGDPVILDASGYLNIAVGTAGTPSTLIVGVFWGCKYVDAASGEVKFSKYWTASTDATADAEAFVIDDPNVMFKIEADQDGTALTAVAIAANTDMIAGTGSTVTGLSGWQLDSSVSAGSGTAQLRIVGSADPRGGPRDNFTAAGTVMDLYVWINEHAYRSTTGV